MARTDMLRRQHDAAVIIVHDISADIRAYKGAADAYELALKLAKLRGLLRIHFAQEDRSLYPAMMASKNPEIAATATVFQDEMGNLGPAFDQFVAKWGTSTAIAADFSTFRDATADLFGKLANRIERENEDLYPLADSVDDPVRAAA